MARLCLWALGCALRRRGALAAALAAMLLKIGLDVLKPWPLKFLVDHVLSEHPREPSRVAAWLPALLPQDLIPCCVAATVILFLLGWVLDQALAYANLGLGQRLVYDLAADLFDHLQRLSLGHHRRRSIGDSIRRVTSDCSCVATIIRDALLPMLTAIVSLVVMFVILWRLDHGLTLLALAVVPYMVMVFRRYAQPMLERSYEQQEIEGRMYTLVEQTLSAIPIVQAFGREQRADQQFRQSSHEVVEAALATAGVQLRFKVLMGLATAMGTAAIFWVGAVHAFDGRLTVGSVLVFLSYLASLYAPLEALVYTSSTVQGAAGSARRVLEVLRTAPEVADRPGALPLPPVVGHLRLEQVTFGYQTGQPVLRHLCLEVLPGQTVAIVGATGAGKTTLVSLIPRFFDPWAGRVLLDGHDLRAVRLKSLRDQVGLVLQEPFLFPLTIAENIAYGRPEASRAEVEAAARAANADGFIQRLPQGYDTPVGERGGTLSGGERQRLAIARALLRDAPILILDEPTSALDAETERLVLEALGRLTKGRTTLVIAHRLSTLRNADRIVVLDQGGIVEEGTQQQLLDRKSLYAHLHGIQFGAPLRGVS
jgi:ATP-binding cassette subfamily B protein/subfamily B ATP-binding cassette protein MsbA